MKKYVLVIFCLLAGFFDVDNCTAFEIVNFNEIVFKDKQYDSRVALSTNSEDFDFITEDSCDLNQNGQIDGAEYKTWVSNDSGCKLYIGNKSGYTVTNTLLWIGIDGDFETFMLDDFQIDKSNAYAADNADIVWLYEGSEDYEWVCNDLKESIDWVVLLDMEDSPGKRISEEAVLSSGILEYELSSYVGETGTGIYIGAFGAIKSGYNSYSSVDSDILWMPSNGGIAPAAPEPISTVLFFVGTGILWKKRFY